MERQDWNERYASEELIWTATPNRFLVAEIAALAPGRALDLAAGEGRNSVWLAAQGWSVRAVDFSDVAIEKAKRLALARNVIDKLEFEIADLRHYQPEAASFDLVALLYLQLPWNELEPILARAARALAPGGTFLLVGHDSTNLTHGYGGPRSAEVLYTAEQVVGVLGGELTIVKAGKVERAVATKDGTRIAIDCLVRAVRS